MATFEKSVTEVSKILGISNKKVINEAIDYLTRLRTKATFKTKNELPRIVICLNISANNANEAINIDKALKLIKYGKVKYCNEKNFLLRILDIEQTQSVESVCNALKLTKVKDVEKTATKLLERLKQSEMNLGEISHLQNICMAIYQSCKLLKVKVVETQLISWSTLRRNQWTKLKSLWCLLLTERKVESTPIVTSPIERSVIENHAIEDYTVWKKRILDKARAKLALSKEHRKTRSGKFY
ncbi:Origin recognition complex subunit 6 [Pseudolycoriella hygida]|uniref:Origin recognition complex subunit 6 n=1 Tax=Pseudolycoriella hygida TaxID=35572 RepID=A0A9Q0S8G6_9DIPT|nr:Origin recognition complex subunit 6 [Pseudolycoriella hygida]